MDDEEEEEEEEKEDDDDKADDEVSVLYWCVHCAMWTLSAYLKMKSIIISSFSQS